MSFDLEDLESLKELESDFNLGFTPLPADMYHFRIGEASKVVRQSKTNEPRLQVVNTVEASSIGDSDGKSHMEFGGWWGKQDVEASTKKLVAEAIDKNNANARRRTSGFWYDFIKAIANNPDSDGEVAGGIISSLRGLKEIDDYSEENFELVDAAFQNILALAEGMDYYASLTHSISKDEQKKIDAELMKEDDARVFVNIRPKNYDVGRSEVADQLATSDL